MKLRDLLPKRFRGYRLVSARKLHKLVEEEYLRKFISTFDIDCIFDVGAHEGKYAQMLRDKIGYQGWIFSFEPNLSALEILIEAAKGDPKWIVEECALSSQDGEQSFHIMQGSQFSSLSKPRHDEVASFKDMNAIKATILVKTETLSTAFKRLQAKYGFQRPYLKLDTQGYDLEIVKHGVSVLDNFVGLQSELAVKKLYENSVDFRDALAVYEQYGFDLSAFIPNNRGHFPLLVETDCIMINRRWLASEKTALV